MSRTGKGITVSLINAVVNIGLSLMKISIGLLAGSISVFLDGLNNFSDIFSSGAAAYGFYLVSLPIDDKYPKGRGRSEYLISFVIALAVLAVAFGFAYSALERLIYPVPIGFAWTYFYMLLLSSGIKFTMGFIFRRVNRGMDSLSLRVLTLDSFQDGIITLMIVATFVVSQFMSFPIDSVAALIMAAFILYNCIKMLIKSGKLLIGTQDGKLVQNIGKVISAISGVLSYSELTVYDYGAGIRTANVKVCINQSPMGMEIKEQIKACIKEKFGIEILIDINEEVEK